MQTLPAPLRSNDPIGGLLAHIAGPPYFPDELTLRRALNILDDLAEEMIGRHAPADVTIKGQIQIHTERLRTWMPS